MLTNGNCECQAHPQEQRHAISPCTDKKQHEQFGIDVNITGTPVQFDLSAVKEMIHLQGSIKDIMIVAQIDDYASVKLSKLVQLCCSPLAGGDVEAFIPAEHLSVDGMLEVGLLPVGLSLVRDGQRILQQAEVLKGLIEVEVDVLVEYLHMHLPGSLRKKGECISMAKSRPKHKWLSCQP